MLMLTSNANTKYYNRKISPFLPPFIVNCDWPFKCFSPPSCFKFHNRIYSTWEWMYSTAFLQRWSSMFPLTSMNWWQWGHFSPIFWKLVDRFFTTTSSGIMSSFPFWLDGYCFGISSKNWKKQKSIWSHISRYCLEYSSRGCKTDQSKLEVWKNCLTLHLFI